MSLFRRILLVVKAVGGGRLQILKDANIFGDFNLCVRDNLGFIITCTSAYVLSILEIRLTATGLTSVPLLQSLTNQELVAQPTSVYSLSQA